MIEKMNFDKEGGLIPAIIQDAISGQVLMLAYMNQEALAKTLFHQIGNMYCNGGTANA
jgi:phosphoribosyl-AMP cyclohydrolase